MASTFNDIVCRQFEAALTTLKNCVAQCPDELWQKPVVNNPFSQSVFHCLFFTDLYLCPTMKWQEEQKFHVDHADVFKGYEQLNMEQRPVCTYERAFIDEYLEFCLKKSGLIVQMAESEKMFTTPASFPWLNDMPLGELHLYNIRHIQHHAAQLVAFLRRESAIEVDWVKSGSN